MESREFERIYAAHAGAIAAYALRRTQNDADAEEIVAETFLIAWRRRGELRGDPLAWLYGVARRVTASHLRRARRAPLELRVDIAAPDGASVERADLLRSALLSLPAGERDALLLTVWEGLDQRACAQALGCSRVAVALRLRRARARLRAAEDAKDIPTVLRPTEVP